MRFRKIASVVAAMSLAPCLFGCGEPSPSAKNVQRNLGETWDSMKTWGVEKKDEFVKSASATLDEIKPKLADARASASRASADAGKKFDEEWKVVQQKFEDMKAAGSDKWDKARDDFMQAYDSFKSKLTSSTGK
jgi:hypothetical protein